MYKSFLEILNQYRRGQKTIKEVYDQVSRLFHDQTDLLEEFTNFLPDSQAPAAPAKNQRKGAKGKRADYDEPADAKHPKAIQKELAFFDKVKNRLRNRETYQEFLKCLNLFSQEIINRNELQSLVYDILGRYPDLMHGFNEFLGRCESMGKAPVPGDDSTTRKAQAKLDARDLKAAAQRDKAMSMRPVAELDLSNCERCGPSYRMLPKGYQRLACSGRTPEIQLLLNDDWVSISSGTEDANSFKNMRKNQYEDNMFRCEDDRFELDMMLETNASCLEEMGKINANVSALPAEERQQMRLEEKNGLSPVHFRCIERIYGDHGGDMVDLLRKNPGVAVPVVLARLKQKDDEWRRVQEEMNKVWKDVYEKNYSKSLDHRSFYQKQLDKKCFSSKGLLSELKELNEKRRAEAAATPAAAQGGRAEPEPDMVLAFADMGVHGDLHTVLAVGANETLSADTVAKLLRLYRDSVASVLGIADQESLVTALSTAEATAAAGGGRGRRGKKRTSDDDEDEGEGMELDGEGNGNETEGAEGSDEGAAAVEGDDEGAAGDQQRFEGCRPLAAAAVNRLGPGAEAANAAGVPAKCTIFCNEGLYVLFRLHYILFERLSSARATAQAAAKAKGDDSEAGGEGEYKTFVGLLTRLLEGSLDSSKFEDECRALLGTGCYTLFTLDKLVFKVVKQLQLIMAEDVGSKLVGLYKYESARGDHGFSTRAYCANACVLAGDDALFKLELSAKAEEKGMGNLSIRTLDESARTEAPACALEPEFEGYLNTMVGSEADGSGSQGVFLKRSARRPEADAGRVTVRNGLECKLNCANSKVSYVLDTEDVFVRRRGAAKPVLSTDHGVAKFHAWMDAQTGMATAS